MEIDKSFVPNIKWMAEKYDEINKTLFNGALGSCKFNVFTTGSGSQGGVLGWFKITGRNIKADRRTRRMFVNSWDRIYIDSDNFVQLCSPTIELNGNYSGTQHGFLATLVHEMCHYYTYMDGYVPKQGHGPEFRRIGALVSQRSKGLFTVQRIASAEVMSELELNDVMKEKRRKRLENKKASVTAVIVTKPNGEIRLTISSNPNVINSVAVTEKNRGADVVTTNDRNVIDFLFDKGYRKNMRTWRYWNIEGRPWINDLKNMLSKPSEQTKPKEPRKIFSINTSGGKFEHDGSSFHSLQKALRERFPKMSDETIDKIMNNPSNYKMEESKTNIKKIVESVISEYMNDKIRKTNDDTIEITPDMNLGEFSPLELF